MGRQLLKSNQVTGVNNPTLQEDLVQLLGKAKYYNLPVATSADLPLTNNVDGEIRLVMDEDALYVWHDLIKAWRKKLQVSTEKRMTNVVVSSDGQTVFYTNLLVGVADGIADLDSISLVINGLMQYPVEDFSVSMDNQLPARLVIEWKSKDFQLEKDDIVAILYDILKIR